jgi:hypothetical protein
VEAKGRDSRQGGLALESRQWVSVLTQPEGNLTKFRKGIAGARLEQVFVFAARQCTFHLGEVQPKQMAQLGDVRNYQV